MKRVKTLTLILLLLITGGCKSTFEGAVKAFDNLTGGTPHKSFEGTYLSQSTLDEYKSREDDLSGTGQVISYSGLSIPADKLRQSHVVDAPVITAYLQRILDELIRHWDGTPVRTQVQIIDSQHFAPYADPYGMISVPLGMLNNVETEHEIAQLLSHELSHLLLRHHQRFNTMEANKANVNTVAEMFKFANIVKDTKVEKSDSVLPDFRYEPSRQGESNIEKAMRYNGIIASLSDNVWNTAWKRTQEDEADLLGMDLAVAAGYAPRAASFTLQRLRDFQGKQQGLLSQFLAQEKLALQQSLAEFNVAELNEQANSFLDRGAQALTGTMLNYFERTHMSTDDREENLRDYVRREYQHVERQRPKPLGLTELFQNASVRNTLIGYQRAFAAASALARNDVKEAERLAISAINDETRYHPGIREVLYNIRMAQGNQKRAWENINLVKDWQHASPNFLKTKVDMELTNRNYQEALAAIQLAESSFGNESLLIIQKAITLASLDRKTEALTTLRKCLSYAEVADTCKVLIDKYERVS